VWQPGPYDNVQVGTILFTLVEPHTGHEVAYNRWYERDHFLAGCMIGKGWFAGRRWVATADLKQLRFPDPTPFLPGLPITAGSYVATYFVHKGEDAEAIAWGSEQVAHLHDTGRMFAERDHVHTLMYINRWAVNRDEDGVPPALALDHPFAGMVAMMVDRPLDVDGDGANTALDARAFSAWLRDECLPAALPDSPVALVLAATPIPLPEGAPVFQPENPGHATRTLLLLFLDEDPRNRWEAIHALADRINFGPGNVAWVAPFVPTIVGTDTYTDQL